MNKKLIFIFLLCIGVISPVNESRAEDQEFQLALKYYDNLEYFEALTIFERLTKRTQSVSLTTLSQLFYSKTLLQVNKLKESETQLLKFLELYSGSRYASEARLTLAKVYFTQKDYFQSFKELIFLVENSDSAFYRNYAKSTAEKIAEVFLTVDQIKNISALSTSKKLKPFLQLLLGKIFLREKQNKDAEVTFLELLQLYPSSEEKDEAEVLYKEAMKEVKLTRENSLIGVILPISNSQSSASALEILEGIKYAVSEFNNGREDKIGLIIKDSELNREKIKEIKIDFQNVKSLKAVLGPIFSSEVRETLEEFKDEDIPIISPTATDDDLTHTYQNFYQANPSFTFRGKVMAQYIFFVENKRSIAVLNALEGYSPVLASAFIREFERLGGSVPAKETYKSGGFNLEAPINNLIAGLADAEGIYIPLADKVDAPVILSQLVQKNIVLSLYGNQDWLYAKGFETSPLLSNQLTFTCDNFIDFNNPEFSEFSSNFFRQTKFDVNRNVLYGYDTAEYLLTVLRNFSGSRDAVKIKLESGLTTNGFHNNICFDEKRINKFLNIVRYKDGMFELVDEFKVNN